MPRMTSIKFNVEKVLQSLTPIIPIVDHYVDVHQFVAFVLVFYEQMQLKEPGHPVKPIGERPSTPANADNAGDPACPPFQWKPTTRRPTVVRKQSFNELKPFKRRWLKVVEADDSLVDPYNHQ
ncbi:hypothetical protein L1987_32817 [Smallanthus sonchifolius]|uniref:Uncharacterized protein n=1 Tax=Smallanthus sonchifolius TaxID=185202 RepID=A0ACB9HNT7_9ASTR|nr:hypothetical protein L1987_32817 [Smallanthus sonchifolius]